MDREKNLPGPESRSPSVPNHKDWIALFGQSSRHYPSRVYDQAVNAYVMTTYDAEMEQEVLEAYQKLHMFSHSDSFIATSSTLNRSKPSDVSCANVQQQPLVEKKPKKS